MAFTTRDPILMIIQDRKDILERLIQEYPNLVNEQEKDVHSLCDEIAVEESNGDDSVEYSIRSHFQRYFEDYSDLKNIFYQAMLIMVYSYYESILIRLSKKASPTSIIEAICKTKGIQLSAECQDDIKYIDSEVKPVRNNICHNNAGTPTSIEKLKSIAQKNQDIVFENETISINGDSFVLDALQKVFFVLSEIVNKLGIIPKKVE